MQPQQIHRAVGRRANSYQCIKAQPKGLLCEEYPFSELSMSQRAPGRGRLVSYYRLGWGMGVGIDQCAFINDC